MSLPLDDAQVTRHTFAQLAEHMQLLRLALGDAGFRSELREQMLLVYWKSLIAGINQPDLEKIMRMFIDPKEG